MRPPPTSAAASPRSRTQNFLHVSLEGSDPELTQRTLEFWLNRFVFIASELKQSKLREYANTQVDNLRTANRALSDAELAYQQFKVGTITQAHGEHGRRRRRAGDAADGA